MNRWKTWGVLLLVVALGLLAGNWLGREAATPRVDNKARDSEDRRRIGPLDDSPPTRPKTADRPDDGRRAFDPDAPPGALPGQRWVTFDSAEAMRRFLASLDGTGIAVLGRLDALNTLRLGVLDADALASLLDGSEETGYIFPAEIPGQGTVQNGAVGFGSQFLSWLGADGDRSNWGKGVTVAVLDTGVIGDSMFANRVRSTNLVDLPGDLSSINNHGTAVASLIASELGLAPDSSILSYRIARDDGTSDTYLIAEAVLAATDAGADIINISLGSSSRSTLLANAIRYATDAGVMVVASTGNNGIDQVSYPAAFDNVIGVGAVDARGEHLDFSNSGDVSIVAPGLALTSASTDGTQVNFSGTSASAPVVAGAIAAVMTQEGISASAAWQLIQANANEAGAPGNDIDYGAGIVDVGRTLNSDVSGIRDVAIAANHITTDAQGNPMVQVTVENRGTSRIVNAPVSVTTPLGVSQLNVTTLAPGDIQTFELPLGAVFEEVRIDSSVGLSGGIVDQNPANNRRVDSVAPSEDPP